MIDYPHNFAWETLDLKLQAGERTAGTKDQGVALAEF